MFIYYNPEPATIALFGALVPGPAFFTVHGYSLTDGTLVVHRLGWNKEFDLRGLVQAEVRPQPLRGSWRLLGNGGLFGWIGTFRNKELGTFRVYATNRYRGVVLELENTKLLLTPEASDEFVAALPRPSSR